MGACLTAPTDRLSSHRLSQQSQDRSHRTQSRLSSFRSCDCSLLEQWYLFSLLCFSGACPNRHRLDFSSQAKTKKPTYIPSLFDIINANNSDTKPQAAVLTDNYADQRSCCDPFLYVLHTSMKRMIHPSFDYLVHQANFKKPSSNLQELKKRKKRLGAKQNLHTNQWAAHTPQSWSSSLP